MEEATAQDIMTTNVETVPDVMPVKEVAAFLIDRQISGAPVIERNGRLVGVVSMTDIVESDAEGGGSERAAMSPFYTGGWERKMNLGDFAKMPIRDEGLLARDIMTPTLYTVPADTPVQRIARTMVAGHIHRLLITRDEQVVGIVTSLDVLKFLCE